MTDDAAYGPSFHAPPGGYLSGGVGPATKTFEQPRCHEPVSGYPGDENRSANCLLDRGHDGDHDPGPTEHSHFYGWSERTGMQSFTHTHNRGGEPHEHILRDGSTEVKRTIFEVSDHG